MKRLYTMITFAAICAGANANSALAADFESEYAISVIGLNIGKSKFKTSIIDNRYKINGTLQASGVASIFTSTSGSLTATGSLGKDKVQPTAFDVKYKDGDKNKRTVLEFSGDNVTKVTNTPKLKKKGKWVDIEKSHLTNVLDPMGAILVPAKSMRSVCNNTLKIFDGEMRADFPMRYLRTIPFSTKGYKGEAVTCRASFKPIAGYDAKKEDINWMRDNGRIEISFAPVGDTGYFAPVAAKIKTRIGMANIRARRFEALTK
ncbi:DUF3108 domain-containing protein [Ahrensia marina]|uniref:DUF3108 domain-containing protein n=1 Tax=Ahrensia marina TaxID=1514904 RepID=A0A0M9GLU6_9HYPH|nr:DUF3108 domain-containing protein [Ahrensia marina]KPB00867.1 hypothetical protein SU32_11750 [Ahrensia marina]